ncbi:transferrin-like isoform X2 [Cylas formicarius]|uniref:transferrin-like isoform X2 n=1 Tax=Cylas formicarius TaxID=197179 RepID=UPI002958406B|nr:transferrin-like isoform X2 [Cylas formicarius]
MCRYFILFFIQFINAQIIQNKLCTHTDYGDACAQIQRDQVLECQKVTSVADCIIAADTGLPSLSVLTAEEALLGASQVTGSASVIGEIIGDLPYQTAVLVRSSFTGGFENLKGSRYCHPGYDHDELVTKFVLEELEWKIISLACSNGTIVEQKFSALASFFGDSCRPGRWTQDDALDTKLKLAYPSLCSKCGSNGCDTKYQEPLQDTLSCLSDSGGDVALTTLNYARIFLNQSSNAQNFRYLCSDGSVSSPDSPCTWTNQLNRIIISSSQSAVFISEYLQSKLPSFAIGQFQVASSTDSVLETSLATVLQLNKRDRVVLRSPTPLSNYVRANRTIPSPEENVKCNLTVRWSTVNELEQGKCLWLRQVAVNFGIQPVISCVRSGDGDDISSLDNISNGLADITFADANYGYIARRKNLTNVAFPETDPRQLSKIVVVIRSESNFSGFGDLKGQRACLPEYGGKEWLAFIDALRSRKILDTSCDYGKLLSDFVGPSCAPGAINYKDYDISGTDSDKLCSNCLPVNNTGTAMYCNADNMNKYYGSVGALKCLSDNSGDYAVISTNDLPIHFRDRDQFKVICRNGSVAQYAGFEVDENAPLTIITAGEVVIVNGSAIYNDAVLLLRDIEKEFGQDLRKPFKVFDAFNRTKDLLFPDSTPGLSFTETNTYIRNFQELISSSEKCGNASSFALRLMPATFVLVVIQLMRFGQFCFDY